MAAVFETTRFAACVPLEVGGSGDPSIYTAAGVVCALEAALDALGLGPIEGKRIAMQGAGNVGAAMIERLLVRGVSHVLVGEISAERRQAVEDRFAGRPVEVVAVEPQEVGVLAAACDVLVPNALGGVLGPKTIPHVKARVVCGAANNQLVDEVRDGRALHERGIVFVPEIISNRMGVVHCANEQYGSLASDPAVERHLAADWEEAIGPVVRRVLARAREAGIPPVEAAGALADSLAARPHPLWPGRGQAIVKALVAERWHRRGQRPPKAG
jgi:glutamate dehydrogenase/leucine dehydrogenase